MAEKKSFIIYHSYADSLNELSDKDAGILIKAILSYSISGEIPDMPKALKAIFLLIKNQMDIDAENYEKVVKSRAESGKKGGRPKKQAVDENEACEEETDEENNTKTEKAKKANAFLGFEEKPNAFFAFQKKAKKPDNEDDNDDVYTNVYINKTDRQTELTTITERVRAEEFDKADRDVVAAMCDAVEEIEQLSDDESVTIDGKRFTAKFVKHVYAKLIPDHFRFGIERLKQADSPPKRLKPYLQTLLYNAVIEMDTDYMLEASHEMRCIV